LGRSHKIALFNFQKGEKEKMIFVKKIFSMLFEDFHWKLLALTAAAVIWFIGMNMSDPYRNLAVSPRLQLDNIEIMSNENIIVINEDLLREINVSVTVRALRSDLDRLRVALSDPERFAEIIGVSADFRAINPNDVFEADGVSVQRLRISPNLQAGFEHISITPSHIDVYLDAASQQRFPVQAVQEGTVSRGYDLQHIRLDNENVRITGARTDLRAISLVQAHFDITNIHDDTEITVPLVVLDQDGNDMTERVQLNVTETTAAVRVWQVRQAYIRVRGSGSPASGFAVAGISGSMESVEIVGSAEVLENFNYLRAEIDLNGANANITHVITLSDWLPEGVSLRQGEQLTMNATARIERIEERVFTVPHGNLRSRGVVGLYQLVNNNASIRVTISGPRSIIADLGASDIIPEFDLRGLAIGVHTVPLSFELPPGLEPVGARPMLTVQIFEPAIANNGENSSEEEPDEIEEEEEPEDEDEDEDEPEEEIGEDEDEDE
jgi:YbbR domain-containing protein